MTKPKAIDCDIFLVMNKEGDWDVGKGDESRDAIERLIDSAGGDCFRSVKVTVRMTPPVTEEVTVTVPEEAGEIVTVKVT